MRLLDFRSYPLRVKLMAAFVVVALVPLFILVLLNDYAARQALTGAANNALYATASQTAGGVDAFVEANLNAVSGDALLPPFSAYLSLPADQRASSQAEIEAVSLLRAVSRKDQANQPYISSYALLDLDGHDVLDTFTPDIGADQSGRDFFVRPVHDGLAYASAIDLASASEAFLYFSAPVKDAAGKVLGVMRVRYNAEVLQQLITQSNGYAGDQSFGILVDENFVRLADGQSRDLRFKSLVPFEPAHLAELQAAQRMPPGAPEGLSTNLPDLAGGLSNAASSRNFTTHVRDDNNVLHAAAVTTLKTQPWFIVFVQPQAAFLAPVETQTRLTLLLALVTGLVVAIAAVGVSQALTSPIRHLTQVAEQVSAGQLSARAPVETADEIGRLAVTFNDMTGRLQQTLAGLEQRVAERTQALETSARVSRGLSTVLDRQALITEVVEQVRAAFNYYYVQIFLFDDARENLVLVGGSGAIGEAMLAKGHHITPGKGLVGRAAATRDAVLAPDVAQEPGWLSNPLLPNTRAEIAVPIAHGDRVLGVLDVQHGIAGGLGQLDADLLRSIADQVAIAVENLGLFEQTQKRAVEMETVAEVSIAASALLQAEKLLQSVVDLTRTRFNLYHAHIYLLNEAGDTLVLAAGAGDVGRRMVAAGHHIPLAREQSLVARAARTRQGVIANDVRQAPDFLPNPLLPNTRSELAVPMIAGNRLWGVFDVQSDRADVFTDADVRIQTILAAQIAVALQNARLYAEQAATVTRLRELDQLKSSFLANMSHELRTPLNSVIGFTEVILAGIDGDVTEQMGQDLQIIHDNGTHLLSLINDILDMAKIESGRMDLHREVFDLKELINEVIQTSQPLAQKRGLWLSVGECAALAVDGDRTRVRQVLLNLISNGLKFSEHGGVTIQVYANGDPREACISVHDTGVGIKPEDMELIFEEFRQIDNATTRKAGGTGLGLPISRRLIEMHGGRLWGESTGEPGQGTTFYFTLSLAALPEAA
jgi:signal transduction histidine kinase/HAMP domain-containing protein